MKLAFGSLRSYLLNYTFGMNDLPLISTAVYFRSNRARTYVHVQFTRKTYFKGLASIIHCTASYYMLPIFNKIMFQLFFCSFSDCLYFCRLLCTLTFRDHLDSETIFCLYVHVYVCVCVCLFVFTGRSVLLAGQPADDNVVFGASFVLQTGPRK